MSNIHQFIQRIQRAQEEEMMIFENGQRNNEGVIVVREGNGYNVDVQNGKVVNCTCPDRFYRGTICKHMVKVALERDIDIDSPLTAPPQGEDEEA